MNRRLKDPSRIISLQARLQAKIAQKKSGNEPSVHEKNFEALLYTLDLLMEDFGKQHLLNSCALCEPMRVIGKHRDEVIVDLAVALFTTFFPSFEGYVRDMRESLLQGLLDRRKSSGFSTWKEKLKGLLLQQIEEDLRDFLEDIHKHLLKYAQTTLDEDRKERIMETALKRLEIEWIGK